MCVVCFLSSSFSQHFCPAAYPVHTRALALRVWVQLDGPFWSELQQRRYKHQLAAADGFMEVWLEGAELDRSRNGSAEPGSVKVGAIITRYMPLYYVFILRASHQL